MEQGLIYICIFCGGAVFGAFSIICAATYLDSRDNKITGE